MKTPFFHDATVNRKAIAIYDRSHDEKTFMKTVSKSVEKFGRACVYKKWLVGCIGV